MEAHELRIGNLVKWKSTGDINDVIKIDVTIKNHCVNHINIKDCEPIPLTEEWLLKFGFEKTVFDSEETGYGVEYDLKNKEFHLSYCDDFSISISYKKENLSITPNIELFRNVHQLQNLYFALTNEELIFKQDA